jgi:hypothetical protein
MNEAINPGYDNGEKKIIYIDETELQVIWAVLL